jgi:hypothetical protein
LGVASATIANAGLRLWREAEIVGMEGDRRIDVVEPRQVG